MIVQGSLFMRQGTRGWNKGGGIGETEGVKQKEEECVVFEL